MTNLNNIYRGDDVSYNMTFKDANNQPIDLTGSTVYFTLKELDDNSSTNTNALISKVVTSHTSPLLGITLIQLYSADTDLPAKIYKYDIQYLSATNVKRTINSGTLSILDDVTK